MGSYVSHDAIDHVSHPGSNWCDLVCPFPLAQSPENRIRLAVLTVIVAFWAERSSDEKVFRLCTGQHYRQAGTSVITHLGRCRPVLLTRSKGTEPPSLKRSALPFASNISRTKGLQFIQRFYALVIYFFEQKRGFLFRKRANMWPLTNYRLYQ